MYLRSDLGIKMIVAFVCCLQICGIQVYWEGLSVFAEVESSLKKMEFEFVGSMLKLQGSLKKFCYVEEMLNQERVRFQVNYLLIRSNQIKYANMQIQF